MIHQINWRNLDDPCWGCSVHMVDWAGCPSGLKEHLIDEYNMSGYQPKKEKVSNEKDYWYENIDRNSEIGMHTLGWLGYGPMVYFLLWPALMAEGVPTAAAVFISLVCIFPWVIFSILTGVGLTLLVCLISYCIHVPFLKKREKKEAKQKEFDNFIKGCRK